MKKDHVRPKNALERQKFDAAWIHKLDELKAFRAEFGHCNVKQICGSLGPWVSNQRASYAKKQLTQDRIEALESIGFEWLLRDSPAVTWQKNFEALSSFSRISGHFNPLDDDLRRWIAMQRSRSTKLTKERVDQLNSIGFDWVGPPDMPKPTASFLAFRLRNAAKDSRKLIEQGIFKVTSPYPCTSWAF